MNGSLNGETKQDPNSQDDRNRDPKRNKKSYDDLTQIAGIGSKTQQALRDHFNMYTYEDLANSSDATIEAAVKAVGRSISSGKAALWRQQAAQLATTKPQQPPESIAQANASFLLIFESGSKLTVRHIESGTIHTFSVADFDVLKQWMMRYVDTNQSASAEASLARSSVDQNTQTVTPAVPVAKPPAELPQHLSYLRYDPNPQRERLLRLIAKANRLAGKR